MYSSLLPLKLNINLKIKMFLRVRRKKRRSQFKSLKMASMGLKTTLTLGTPQEKITMGSLQVVAYLIVHKYLKPKIIKSHKLETSKLTLQAANKKN